MTTLRIMSFCWNQNYVHRTFMFESVDSVYIYISCTPVIDNDTTLITCVYQVSAVSDYSPAITQS